MGLLGRETPPGEGLGSCPPWALSVPHPGAPNSVLGSLWNLPSGQLPARPHSAARGASPSPVPHLVTASTSAFLECVCISNICIFGVFKNLFSL